MNKLAKDSFGEDYLCKYKWDYDCFVQCGDEGLVLSNNNDYFTAFFEAFPKSPNTFIRGEGNTIEEAEEKAWSQLQRYKECKNHEYERNGYTNGSGFCKHCGLFKSHAFEPSTKCKKCNKPTAYTCDINNEWYCEEHKDLIPNELLNNYQLRKRIEHKRMNLTKVDDIINLKDIDDNVREFMIFLFNQEGEIDISNIGRYSYSESMIKSNRLIKRNKFISFEEKVFNNDTYYCIIISELDKETKKSNGRFIKLFSPCNNYFKTVIEAFNHKK